MATPTRMSREYQTGINTEMRVLAFLERQGVFVARVRHGGDIAPALRTWDRHITLPDIQAIWPRERRDAWVEVKWKANCGVAKRMGDLKTTGVDLENWAAYCDVERITLRPVVLVFVHQAERVVKLARLNQDLVPSMGNGAGMVYWDFEKLGRLCTYGELMDTDPRVPRLDEPLFAPPPEAPIQLGLFDAATPAGAERRRPR